MQIVTCHTRKTEPLQSGEPLEISLLLLGVEKGY